MTIRPVRLQLSRRSGFRLQELSRAINGLEAVNVARPSRWGNPFTRDAAIESEYATEATWRAFVVECFRDWLGPTRSGRDWWQGPESDACRAAILTGLPTLRGKNLACWCALPAAGAPDICHAAVLLEIANREPGR